VARIHADEVPTDVALVRRLLAEQFPDWVRLAVEPVLSFGTDNALYRLGEEMVVRLPRNERSTTALRKERRWLPRLAPFLPLVVPVPLAEGEPGAGYPFQWSVYRWLSGADASQQAIADGGAFAIELARFVLALQRIDAAGAPGPGEHNVFRGVPLAVRDVSTRAAIDSLGDTNDREGAVAVWEEALRASEWQGAALWIHGDLDARNLLLEHGRLSAVIDWGCLAVGDPACDVMVAWKLTAETRDVFRATVSVDDACWTRARGWALSQAVNALSYYTPETNPVLFGEAQRWLAAVLDAA
jgi:aminoglycoside phosphotransferase (APT) family kinase protein